MNLPRSSHLTRHLTPHLTDDDMIRLLYGIGDADGHLAVCPECDARWSEMQRALGKTREESAIEISGRRLALQRQQILERLEQPSPWRESGARVRWVPAAAAASLLAVALWSSSWYLRGPEPAQAPAAVNAESDAELFTDVYSMEQDVEPRAAAPIHGLFQQASFEPAAAAEESQKQ